MNERTCLCLGAILLAVYSLTLGSALVFPFSTRLDGSHPSNWFFFLASAGVGWASFQAFRACAALGGSPFRRPFRHVA